MGMQSVHTCFDYWILLIPFYSLIVEAAQHCFNQAFYAPPSGGNKGKLAVYVSLVYPAWSCLHNFPLLYLTHNSSLQEWSYT